MFRKTTKYEIETTFENDLIVEVACSLARRRDLRRCASMPLLTCPCRFATPQRVDHNQKKVASAGKLRPTSSVFPYVSIPKGRSLVAFRKPTRYEKATMYFARFVVDVVICYYPRHENERPCSLSRRRLLRRCGTFPLLICPCRRSYFGSSSFLLWPFGNLFRKSSTFLLFTCLPFLCSPTL